MSGLRKAALFAFLAHGFAALGMLLILNDGLQTAPDLQTRLTFIGSHRLLWTIGWLALASASLSFLYFVVHFTRAHRLESPFESLITAVAVAADLSGQSLEIGVIPDLLTQPSPTLFLTIDRVTVILSAYLANGLYCIAAVSLAWKTRERYPGWVTAMALGMCAIGFAESYAGLRGSTTGLFWTNAFLMPGILIWMLAAAWFPPASNESLR